VLPRAPRPAPRAQVERASQPAPQVQVTDRTPADAGPPASTGSARQILIVEDDVRFAEVVVALARELDFDAMVAANASQAIALATQHPPKGIILDIKLPDQSGLAVLEQLKRDSRTRHIPVHVMSIADHTRAAFELGAIGYTTKPVEREQIKAALRKLERLFTRRMRRLLVVEADLAQRETIYQLLEGEHVEIVTVGTVKDALDQLRIDEFDCVVTDLQLPDASGFQLLEAMAADEARNFPSVVVYTGHPLTADDEERLRRYSSSIIMKSARSPERLLDEVTLFLHQLESELPPERQRMLRRARHREAIFEDRKILIVEDDVRNVFALTSALEPKGMELTIARNGREALQALDRDAAFDLVLMDTMMPEMDGLEATRAIRRQPRFAALPIIALTAKAMKDDHERCLQAGANDYMAKPLDVERLLALLRVWMSKTVVGGAS
jgi:CheY-like chemotaxis protein